MSQHYYTANMKDTHTVTVFCGFDRMLQQHFLDVWIPSDNDSDADEMIYSSLEDMEAPHGFTDWPYYAEQLKALDISIPDDMHKALEADAIGQVGNSIKHWS